MEGAQEQKKKNPNHHSALLDNVLSTHPLCDHMGPGFAL